MSKLGIVAVFGMAGVVAMARVSPAQAQGYSATIHFTESAGNVVGTAYGSVDLSALTGASVGATVFDGVVNNFGAYVGTSANFGLWTSPNLIYDVTSSPLSQLGLSSPQWATAGTSTGTYVGWFEYPGGGPQIEMDSSYISGSQLNTSATWVGNTFSAMSLNVGTYRWTYGSSGQNEVKIVVGGSLPGTTGGGTTGGGGGVPEPGEWAAMGILGAGLTGLVIRKRKQA